MCNYLCLKNFLKVSFLCFLGVQSSETLAADVTSWADINTNKTEANINFANDIIAEGGTYPMPISFTSNIDQTINGNYHSFSSQDKYTDRWYYYSLSVSKTGGSLNLTNLGKSSNGDASDNTFSYMDIDGNTVYKNIDASVNNWKGYFLTINKPITTNITNSVFANNGKGTDAKLIYVSGSGNGTLNVNNSIFYNNNIANVEGVVSGGRYDLNVENTVFYGNRNANFAGGALYGNGIVNVKNSYFINNVAEKDTGGAISLGGSATLTVESSRFEGNSSDDDGGAISGWGSTNVALIKDSQFINNHNGGTYYDGGAISLGGGYIQTMDNVLFEGNVACSKGGGVYQGMNGSNTKPPILVKNTIFKNNEASTGGGYYTDGQGRKNYTYIIDSEFTNNIVKATDHYMDFGIPVGGGMISAGNVPIIINNTTFTGNTADPEGNYSAGGGIYFAGESASYPIKIVDSTFTNNSALEGGAIYIQNADTSIIAQTKDVIFSGNTAGADADDYNGGADIYFDTSSYSKTLLLNAADEKKIVFNGSIAVYEKNGNTATIDINNSGVTYNTYDGTTETPVTAGSAGEVQFNARVGDKTHSFSAINLYGGKLSIGQNDDNNANTSNPDGYINDNNFYIKGDSILNTVNGIVGEFAPKVFAINAVMQYEFDVDLANTKSDILTGATVNNGGGVSLAVLNLISDTDQKNLKVTYSDTNINGSLKDDYQITTSTASYDVVAKNDDTGSYLLFSRAADTGGLPKAIENGSDAYSITDDHDEVVTSWRENSLKADLSINGNNHAIITENGLDGIHVGSPYTLTMNNVSDVKGFINAINNEGTVKLSNTTISDNLVNNGVMEINENVTLGTVQGAGTTNINADHALKAPFDGNILNVKNSKLSGVNNLSSNVSLNAIGAAVALDNEKVNVKSADFDANSTLSLTINSLTDYGFLAAQNITVADGAKLKATLGQGFVTSSKTATLQLLKANNTDFNNFTDCFENNMYHFQKSDTNGAYTITLTNTAEDVVKSSGARHWVSKAASSYIDQASFEKSSVAGNIADKLSFLAQNDANALITAIKSLAPTETAVVQGQSIENVDRLHKTVDSYLRGKLQEGLSSGDALPDLTLWAKPYIGKSKLSNRGKISGLDTDSRGIIVSAEKKIHKSLKLGTGLQYDNTDIDAFNRDIDADTLLGFIYGEYSFDHWFINTTGAYSQSDYDEYKYALQSKYAAHYDVHTASLSAVTGYSMTNYTPEIGLRYYHIKRDGYTDSAMQKVAAVSTDILRATAGIHLHNNYAGFYPDLYIGLTYDLISGKDNTLVNLSNNTSYTVEGKSLPRLGYEMAASLNKDITDNLTFGINYIGFYRQNYQEHTGMISLRYNF